MILIVEKKASRHASYRIESIEEMTVLDSLGVGLLQCFALIPGTSRSGATIIGGMALGLSRKAATEFSFFLGIPTLMGAGVYSIIKEHQALQSVDTSYFFIGLIFSFFSALLCIQWLMRYIATHTFTFFAWYRIVFGLVIMLTAYANIVDWSV